MKPCWYDYAGTVQNGASCLVL